jgi:hypothetical protein
MKRTLIKWSLLYIALWKLNNFIYADAPQNQQHPTELLTFFNPQSDTTDLTSAHSRLKKIASDDSAIALKRQVDSLLTKMARIECPDGDINVVNQYGYMGKYQFGSAALRTCGIRLTSHQFRRNPDLFPEELQDKAFLRFCISNREEMEKYIEKYAGRRIKNITITETNIVAASHGGTGRVVAFLKSNGRCDPKDGNGTPISYYFKKFESTRVNFDKALAVL